MGRAPGLLHAEATLLILVRHGETEWNASARIQGHTDIALNARGRRQAAALADALLDCGACAVYASDLSRASQTAAPVAAALGLPLRMDPRLRERAFGAFEGRSFAELAPVHPEACARWRGRDPSFAAPGGGERLDDFHDRVAGAALDIAAAHPGGVVVVVSHGGALDCLHRAATGQALDAPRTWELRNAAIHRVLVAEGRMTMVGWNDCAHLVEGLDETTA